MTTTTQPTDWYSNNAETELPEVVSLGTLRRGDRFRRAYEACTLVRQSHSRLGDNILAPVYVAELKDGKPFGREFPLDPHEMVMPLDSDPRAKLRERAKRIDADALSEGFAQLLWSLPDRDQIEKMMTAEQIADTSDALDVLLDLIPTTCLGAPTTPASNR